MKRAWLILVVLLQCVLYAKSEPVSTEEAKAKAVSFISQNSKRFRGAKAPELLQVVESKQAVENRRKAYGINAAQPAYYIFNFADSTGFVIVSAESITLDILAYSDEGYFHVEDIDKGAEVFLCQYERDAEIARTKGLTAQQKQYVSRRADSAVSGEVLLKTASIGQNFGNWNNKYSPLKGDGVHSPAPAGCVATAATIIMQYHKWPAQGKGSKSYISKTHKLELSRDFSQDTYNWACIPDGYDVTTSAPAKEEVPKILLASGIACEMDYDYGGSAASTYKMMDAMVENFSYSIEYNTYLKGKDNPDMTEAWQASHHSLDNNMPVLVSGISDSDVAHAFLLDGYNDQNYHHYNMGWGGTNDGWWATSSIFGSNYDLYEFITDICPQTGKILCAETLSTGISFIFDDKGLLTISGTGELPADFSSNYLGKYKNKVKKCVINEGVSSLLDQAFLSGLRTISIPASVEYIAFDAIPHDVEEIVVAEANPVFSSPGNVSLYNKDNKELIFFSALQSEVIFPEGIKEIGQQAFANNNIITSLEIPEGVETIGYEAFNNSKNLRELTLPSTLTDIGLYAFYGTQLNTLICKAMCPITTGYNYFPNSVKEGTLYVPYGAVEKYKADYRWNTWKEIKPIPGSETWEDPHNVTISMVEAGTLASQLKVDPASVLQLTVSGPINSDDIATIRQMCGRGVYALKSLDLRKARIVVGGGSYFYDYSVKEDDELPEYMLAECKLDELWIPEATKKICRNVMPWQVTAIELPEGLLRIEENAFQDSYLTTVRIPASVEYIDRNAFAACWSLATLEVAPGNKYYKADGKIIYTIDGKKAVASSYIAEKALFIGHGVETVDCAFDGSYEQLFLPATLKEIKNVFSSQDLKEVTCYATDPPTVIMDIFPYIYIWNATLYVPEGSAELYRQAYVWKDFGNIVEINMDAIQTVTTDSNDAQNIYDISGHRISNTSSLQPGVYIINGKKVVQNGTRK